MLGYILKPANLFTAASLFCGVLSLVTSAGADPHESEAFLRAALLIFFAGIFDGLDGRVARLTKTESEFGVQLDSLVDAISFGVAPGVLLYKWGLEAYGDAGFLVAFLFILAGVFRLARFNIRAADTDAKPTGPKLFNEGLAITWGGGTVAVLVLHHAKIRATEVDNHVAVLLLTLLLSYLMISTVRFRTFRGLNISPSTVAGLLAFMAGVAVTLVLADWTMLLVVLAFVYIGLGLLEEAFHFARHRRADDVYYLDDLEPDEVEDEEAPAV